MRTVEQMCEDFLDVLSRLGRNLPAIDIKFFLILPHQSLPRHLPLVLDVQLIAHDHQNHLVEVQVLVCLEIKYLPAAAMTRHRGRSEAR